ncbi:MAG: hypothetical protein RLZZ367_111 [Bacteroidota bacterium]
MIRSRIAPTPSGYLHMGNALNFIITWLAVRKQNGVLRLRIDDIDNARTRTEYLDDIFDTLHWLGLDWDEGPVNTTDHQQNYSQVNRTARYQQVINQLIDTGQVFACSCSRKTLEQQLCTCYQKQLPLNQPDTALKLHTPENLIIQVPDVQAGTIPVNLHQCMSDFVIRRRESIIAYQIASLADDTDYGINLIVRGNDLLDSTAAQLYIAQLTGNTSFGQTAFYHHKLITGADGSKLSKSAGSTSLKAWREGGKSSADFYQLLCQQLQLPEPCHSAQNLLTITTNTSAFGLLTNRGTV